MEPGIDHEWLVVFDTFDTQHPCHSQVVHSPVVCDDGQLNDEGDDELQGCDELD